MVLTHQTVTAKVPRNQQRKTCGFFAARADGLVWLGRGSFCSQNMETNFQFPRRRINPTFQFKLTITDLVYYPAPSICLFIRSFLLYILCVWLVVCFLCLSFCPCVCFFITLIRWCVRLFVCALVCLFIRVFVLSFVRSFFCFEVSCQCVFSCVNFLLICYLFVHWCVFQCICFCVHLIIRSFLR